MADKPRTLAIVLLATVAWSAAPKAQAVDPPDLFLDHLADFVWTGAGGNTTWENSANWTAPMFPMGYPYPIPTYPNDPGRIDDPGTNPPNTVNITTIYPVVGANLSGALIADRTVNIANGNVTVASLKLGGTGVAVTTDITTSEMNRLVFENSELNDTATNPGNPNVTPKIEPEPIWSFNQARALIWSTGTPGAGKENRITGTLQLNDGVDVEGDRDFHVYGDIYEGVIDRDGYQTGLDEILESSISNLMSGGAKLYLHGTIHTNGANAAGTVTSSDGPGGDRGFGVNTTRGIPVPADPQMPPAEVPRQGTIDIEGKFAGNGLVSLGAANGNAVPLGTTILRGDSTGFTGRFAVNRGNVVIGNDKAFGEGILKTGNPPQGFGFNLISNADNRKITNAVQTAQWQTVRGGTSVAGLESIGDHSIEFSGKVTNTNTRGWINLLPTGKTLTLSGPQYPLEAIDDVANYDTDRIYTIDGSGKTLISGGILDRDPEKSLIPPGGAISRGHLRVRGTGAVYVDWDGVQDMIPDPNNAGQMIPDPEDRYSDYGGYTWVQGSNLHFAENNDLGGGEMLSRGGAVGVDAGVVNNNTFLTKFRNSSNPNSPGLENFFLVYDTNQSIYTKYSAGGLMLGTNEYNQDLNFTTGDLARAANMTLAAHEEGGSIYTGTITPSSTVAVNPNTYLLGGGSGTLTLPNAQLTGARNLLVTNGGEVLLKGANTYSGTTRVVRKLLPSGQSEAITNARRRRGQ